VKERTNGLTSSSSSFYARDQKENDVWREQKTKMKLEVVVCSSRSAAAAAAADKGEEEESAYWFGSSDESSTANG
jgi:hypothetical protein